MLTVQHSMGIKDGEGPVMLVETKSPLELEFINDEDDDRALVSAFGNTLPGGSSVIHQPSHHTHPKMVSFNEIVCIQHK